MTEAIIDIVNDPSTKAGGIIKKAFGGTAIIKGGEVEALLESDVAAAAELIKAVQ